MTLCKAAGKFCVLRECVDYEVTCGDPLAVLIESGELLHGVCKVNKTEFPTNAGAFCSLGRPCPRHPSGPYGFTSIGDIASPVGVAETPESLCTAHIEAKDASTDIQSIRKRPYLQHLHAALGA